MEVSWSCRQRSTLKKKHYSEIDRTTDIEYPNLVNEITKETGDHKDRIEQCILALKNGGKS